MFIVAKVYVKPCPIVALWLLYGCSWVAHGPLMGCSILTLSLRPWESYEHPMSILWASYEYPMSILWGEYERNCRILLVIYEQMIIFAGELVREWGASPQLSRSCKQPRAGANTMSLIFLGRRSPPGCKSEYLPFQTNAPLPVSGVRLQGAIRVLLYKSQGGLCRETRVSHFLN